MVEMYHCVIEDERGGPLYKYRKTLKRDATWIPLTDRVAEKTIKYNTFPFYEVHVDTLPIFRGTTLDI